MRSSHVVLDQVDIAFDDPRAVASAGLLLPATLAERLGIERATDQLVDLGERPGAGRPGRKLLTLVHALAVGADCIDDVELLRAGSTASVLGHRVMAASTVGTWLRSFTFGHVRQLDKVTGEILTRAWAAGAGPGDGPLTVDIDSTICEVHGYHKQGACYGYTHRLGYHPLLATRAEGGEVLHARLRKGAANTARGVARFVDELVARLRRPRGQRRVDLADGLGVLVGQAHPAAARPPGPLLDHGAPDQDGTRGDRGDPRAGLGRDRLPAGRGRPGRRDRLPRRPAGRASRAEPRRPAAAVPNLALPRLCHRPRRHRHLAGRRSSPPRRLRADHPRPQGGRRPGPSAVRPLRRQQRLAAGRHPGSHLLRWTVTIGLGARDEQLVAKTLRRTLLVLPGRLTRSARCWRLHLPAGWPWAHSFQMALARLRCIPYAT